MLSETKTKGDKVSVLLPFWGFYESLHSEAIDSTIESDLQDSDGEIIGALYERVLNIGLNYPKAFETYCRDYVYEFGAYYEIPGMEYDELDSPMFYNYGTDRVFAFVPYRSLYAMAYQLAEEESDALEVIASEWFTSRPGFCSHYSPNVATWGDTLQEYDHNQLGALLSAYLLAEFDDSDADGFQREYSDMVFTSVGAGYPIGHDIQAALMNGHAAELERIFNAASYLRQRGDRRHGYVFGR